jgi:phytoene desaturase
MASAVVVGAGLGGLSAAIRLAVAGWSVDVYDKNAEVGGRMSTVSAGEYRWDVGPTLIMMPEGLYRIARPSLIERTFRGARDVPGVLGSLLRVRPADSVASMAARHFRSPRLRRAFSFQTLYLGTRPERVPAAYVMIPFVEAALGVWYPRGGVHTIAAAMARLAAELGVRVHLERPVARIVTDVARADAVVANAEWGYTQGTLLPRGERVAGRDWGCSGVLFLLAVRRRIEGPHHTFLLADDFEGNLSDIFDRRRMPATPSIYVSRPTATDPGLAPAGTELLYVLVPAPTLASGVDWQAETPVLRARVFDRLGALGLEGLERDVVAEATLTPETFARRYNLTEGSAFGLAATLFQSGPFRPTIRSRRWAGLYHVGASSHPGGGVPIVTLSGQLAAEAACEDVSRGRVPVRERVPRPAVEAAWSGAVRS